MLFSSNFSNPRSFQQQLSAVQQQPQRTLQRPGVSVSGSTTALHHQHCGQHRNISDGLQTAPTQNHSAVHLCVSINMSMSCSNHWATSNFSVSISDQRDGDGAASALQR
jgi:hypothetical protein